MNRWHALGVTLASMWLVSEAPYAQRESAQASVTRLEFEPWGDRPGPWIGPERLPILAGEKMLVASALRLFALDARTGELAWSAGPAPGWKGLEAKQKSALFEGMDEAQLVTRPAAGKNIAVAALQVPEARWKSETVMGIQFEVSKPERRRFAFELDTGRELWNHAPPANWDGQAGTFSQRMSLVAPPLVVGSRVFVPCTSDRSSIDYHVACYRLDTGGLLWSTFVTRGQVERRIVGGQALEFVAAPLIAMGRDRVIAQTGLGRIAALSIDTGDLLWKIGYESIPLPKKRSYTPPRRIEQWRSSPPMIAAGLLLATPRDCAELLLLNPNSGARVGSISAEVLRGLGEEHSTQDVDHLIGTDAETVFLGGKRGVYALTRPGGFGSDVDWRVSWAAEREGTGRAMTQLVNGRLFWTCGQGRLEELDPRDGRAIASTETGPSSGFLATDGTLFVVAPGGVRRINR